MHGRRPYFRLKLDRHFDYREACSVTSVAELGSKEKIARTDSPDYVVYYIASNKKGSLRIAGPQPQKDPSSCAKNQAHE
jgi:pimeloyl-CoA synthetase